MGPTWGPPGSCRPQMGPMLAPRTLLSGLSIIWLSKFWFLPFLNWEWKSVSLKGKCCHFDEIVIVGCTGSCQKDNFQCRQWWKFCRNDDISISLYTSQESCISILCCDLMLCTSPFYPYSSRLLHWHWDNHAISPWTVTHHQRIWVHIDGLEQKCSISSALAMEIRQSCTKPSIYHVNPL